MARICKTLGCLMVAVGIAALVGFGSHLVGDEDFARARLLKERNPGNVMYESQYFVAVTVRAFLVGGVIVGALLAINGGTLVVIGILAARLDLLRAATRLEPLHAHNRY